jgi:hypothetical protein
MDMLEFVSQFLGCPSHGKYQDFAKILYVHLIVKLGSKSC